MNYFSPIDIASCAKHRETKCVFNKHWLKWCSLSNTMAEVSLAEEIDQKRLSAVIDRSDEIDAELQRIAAALRKCCEPEITFGSQARERDVV